MRANALALIQAAVSAACVFVALVVFMGPVQSAIVAVGIAAPVGFAITTRQLRRSRSN